MNINHESATLALRYRTSKGKEEFRVRQVSCCSYFGFDDVEWVYNVFSARSHITKHKSYESAMAQAMAWEAILTTSKGIIEVDNFKDKTWQEIKEWRTRLKTERELTIKI